MRHGDARTQRDRKGAGRGAHERHNHRDCVKEAANTAVIVIVHFRHSFACRRWLSFNGSAMPATSSHGSPDNGIGRIALFCAR